MFKKLLKGHLFLVCVLFFGAQCYGQWAIPWQMRSEGTLDHLIGTNGFLKPDLLPGTPLSNGSLKDHTFIDQKWSSCSFLLFDPVKLIEGYLVKYDIKGNALAVKTKSGVKLIDANKIKSIVWLDSLTNAPRYFVNAQEYKEESVQLTGLLEVLVDGHMPLFAQSYLVEKETGFFAGVLSLFEKEKREKKFDVKKFFYIGSGRSLAKIISTKELLLSFGDFYWDMEEYIKKHKLDISTQTGLQKVFEYYNTKFERLPDY